jgi:3-mercaptopyruvate sulfurtransferase SseA
VYCSVGWRSAIAARELVRRGARDVRNLEGGIFQWANEGRPVYRSARVVREVHPFDRLWAVFLDDELETYAP